MIGAERGFLLLGSFLGNPDRKPLTTAQLRNLRQRAQQLEVDDPDRDLNREDLMHLGCGPDLAERILALLSEDDLLEYYLRKGSHLGCVPLTRAGAAYPAELRQRLGADCPGCLWIKGDPDILKGRKISLVGSRLLNPENKDFAREVGRQAALQGYTLVSGNASGADRTAQEACLGAGGRVISVVATPLAEQPRRDNILWMAEEDYDQPFTAARALSRNRVIHAMGEKTFAAQCSLETGGTWDGSVKNLRFGWSPLLCFDDGSAAVRRLCAMGAEPIGIDELQSFSTIIPEIHNLFDQ